MESINQILARELNREQTHIDNVVKLLDEGNTIPFIARYRKELHGAMDDTALRTLAERLEYLRSLAERRETVKNSITEQGKMTPELSAAIDEAATLAALEDLYRPYKPKRRTRATIAKEKGLEPLAAALFAQGGDLPAPEVLAADYVNAEKGVETVEDALSGASDIVAELISDDAEIRKKLRGFIESSAYLVSRAATEDDSVYRLYYDFKQRVDRLQGHQILAVNRGEKEGFLKAGIELDRELALQRVRRAVIVPGSAAMAFVRAAADDAYDRLIWPSMEREERAALTDMACEGAIKMFALNLKPLLMQPPVKGRVTMGLDPGYRNGCKVAVIDGTGKVLDTAVVYPTFSEGRKREAIRTLSALIRKHGVEHIAIGNGTASRETEQMTVEMLHELGGGQSYAIVNEAGASVYSASPSLLQRVSGLTKTTAKNIVAYREENGAFTSRSQINKVPKLGPKAFQQCAGFLRVPESAQVLDNTAVHPESYDAAKKLLKLCSYTLDDVAAGAIGELPARVKAMGAAKVAEECAVGVPTLNDIVAELLKPGRDPRDELPPVLLRKDVLDIKDLKPGMDLMGTVRNVIDFGVFVDIGVHQDGLVHISQVSDKFIRHPSEAVAVGDVVKVVVLDVDEKKHRISLSMKQASK